MEVLRALYVCASGLRFSGRSCQEYTPHTMFVLLEPELPRTRARDCESATARALRHRFAETKTNLHGATARALRHARSPRRVLPALKKRKKTASFCTSTTPIRPRRSPQRVARAPQESGKKTRVFAPRPRLPAEGSSAHRKNAKNLEFLYLDHADPRRGPRGHRKNRKKPGGFAPRPRRSPQGSRGHRKNRKKKHEFLHLDHADPRRGLQSRSTSKVLPRRPRKLNFIT